MRILALTEESDRCETALLIGLKRAGLDVSVVGSPKPDRALELHNNGISVLPLRCRSKIDLSAIRALRRIFRAEPVGIVHAFTSRMLANALIASFGVQTKIVAYRGTIGHVSRFDPTSWISFLNPRISAISCVSSAVREYLLTCGVPPHKLFVIYKGHEVDWYCGEEPIRLAELGIPENSFVISCVANMRPVKGVDILIEAVHELVQTGSIGRPVHLLLIGEVRDQSVRRIPYGAESYVHFLGFRSDAGRIVKSSTLYVQPSRAREGLPKAVIEAMSQGVPVIVSDAGGLPELVRHEVDGIVCTAGQSKPLTLAVERMLNDDSLRKRLSSSAVSRIRDAFQIQTTIEQTLAMYKALE